MMMACIGRRPDLVGVKGWPQTDDGQADGNHHSRPAAPVRRRRAPDGGVRGIAALLFPTHLVMLAAGLLILSGPFRTAWSDGREWAPTSFGRFLPALLSPALTVALVAFFFMYVAPFRHHGYGPWIARYTRAVTRRPARYSDGGAGS